MTKEERDRKELEEKMRLYKDMIENHKKIMDGLEITESNGKLKG